MEDFDPARAEHALRDLANPAPLHALSARKGAGLKPWLDWLRAQRASVRAVGFSASASSHEESHHAHGESVAR
jgi:hypothetical protein